MEERQVTIDGITRKVPEPLMVLATQNPIESKGTNKLPEEVRVSDNIKDLIINIVTSTRNNSKITLGTSPRWS